MELDVIKFPVICGFELQTESTGLLTDAYLTSHIFKVLYLYVSNGNCSFIYIANGFLYIFLFVSALGFF